MRPVKRQTVPNPDTHSCTTGQVANQSTNGVAIPRPMRTKATHWLGVSPKKNWSAMATRRRNDCPRRASRRISPNKNRRTRPMSDRFISELALSEALPAEDFCAFNQCYCMNWRMEARGAQNGFRRLLLLLHCRLRLRESGIEVKELPQRSDKELVCIVAASITLNIQ